MEKAKRGINWHFMPVHYHAYRGYQHSSIARGIGEAINELRDARSKPGEDEDNEEIE